MRDIVIKCSFGNDCLPKKSLIDWTTPSHFQASDNVDCCVLLKNVRVQSKSRQNLGMQQLSLVQRPLFLQALWNIPKIEILVLWFSNWANEPEKKVTLLYPPQRTLLKKNRRCLSHTFMFARCAMVVENFLHDTMLLHFICTSDVFGVNNMSRHQYNLNLGNNFLRKLFFYFVVSYLYADSQLSNNIPDHNKNYYCVRIAKITSTVTS